MTRSIICLAAAALLLGATAPASADDTAAKPPAKAWAGVYAGIQGGMGWTRDKLTETSEYSPPNTGNAITYGNGALGGAHAGYNWQFTNVVVGVEGDFEVTGLDKSSSCLKQDSGAGNGAPGTCFSGPYSFRTQIPWQSSLRARLGYAWGRALVYATGGIALAEIKVTNTTNAAVGGGSQEFTNKQFGDTIGAGVDYRLGGNWVGRVEYRFTHFRKTSNDMTSAGGFWNGYTDKHDIEENTLRVGLSYMF